VRGRFVFKYISRFSLSFACSGSEWRKWGGEGKEGAEKRFFVFYSSGKNKKRKRDRKKKTKKKNFFLSKKIPKTKPGPGT
jgi:hypothetical protein